MKQLKIFKEEKTIEETLNNFFDNNINDVRKGFAGEQLCRQFIRRHNKKYHQLDLLFENNNKLCSVEVKASEMYNNPDAHGLSVKQFQNKMWLYKKYNIIPDLFIYCQTNKKIYWNNFIELKNGQEFYSKTGTMILFPIKNYHEYSISDYV